MDEKEMKEAKETFEFILGNYNKGLTTEEEKNNAIFMLLYKVLHPEEFN